MKINDSIPLNAIKQANQFLQIGQFQSALEVLSTARQGAPDVLALFPQTIRCLIFCGEHAQARELAREYCTRAADNPAHLAECAQLMVQCQLLEDAVDIYRQLAAGDSRDGKYNLAANLVALGQISEAGNILQALLQENPRDGQAQLVRSGLRKATDDSNNVDHIGSLLNDERLSPMDRIQMHYALGKELEDLQEFSHAFEHFQSGARMRRQSMQYRVEGDLETLKLIRQHHTGKVTETENPEIGSEAVFVFGLPRSGTTLVDRVLSSHSECLSLGEITDFPMSLMVSAGTKRTKEDLVQDTAAWPAAKIADNYLRRLRSYPRTAARNIDKTPQNFLYAGLIARSMPGASMIWMDRHPLDACFAMYKTLFQMGYPFSYDLADLGKYYIGYWKLKSLWQEGMAERIRFQHYDKLVDDFPHQARELVEYVGLDWQQDCEDFHKNKSAIATASSVQVREPLYKSGIGHWRHYESQLGSLAEMLQQAGVPV